MVGHAPVNLGWDALLQARQPLAHSGMLVNIYVLSILPNIGFVLLTAGTLPHCLELQEIEL